MEAMQESMADDYSKNIQAFFNMLGPELEQSEGMFHFGWWLWPIGRYVERYGNKDWIFILLADAPSVLGCDTWRKIDQEVSY